MNTSSSSTVLLGLALTLILGGISIFFFRSSPSTGYGTHPLTKFFLVALRLAIGWHFFVEGMDKLNNPSWTSEPYLREATGPLAPKFRELAGDRLIDKLMVGKEGSFPSELNIEWQTYLDAFSRFYGLNAEQTKQAADLVEQTKAKTKTWLTVTSQMVQKISEYPPPLMVPMTVPERIKEYESLQSKVHEIEEVLLPQYGADVFAKLKTAKANLSKWRGELKADLDKQTVEMKKSLRDQVLVPIVIKDLPPEFQGKVNAKDPVPSLQTIYHQLLLEKAQGKDVKQTSQDDKIFEYAIDKKKAKQDANDYLPAPDTFSLPARPVNAWSLLDWSDFLVKWGIIITGTCLLLGLLTRTFCVVGACLLFMFFLAMPPLPGWPESPRAEGHYLYINKNIIEMLALLALATTCSGRWVGLDGLLQFLCPKCWRKAPSSSTLERVAVSGEEPTIAINPSDRR